LDAVVVFLAGAGFALPASFLAGAAFLVEGLADLAEVLVFVVVFALLVDAFALAAGFEAVLALGFAAGLVAGLAVLEAGFEFWRTDKKCEDMNGGHAYLLRVGAYFGRKLHAARGTLWRVEEDEHLKHEKHAPWAE
jgi:hypothetical protein